MNCDIYTPTGMHWCQCHKAHEAKDCPHSQRDNLLYRLYRKALDTYGKFNAAILRMLGAKVGRGTRIIGQYHWPWRQMNRLTIGDNCLFEGGGMILIADQAITIGEGCHFDGQTKLLGLAPIVIGKRCKFVNGATLIATNHNTSERRDPITAGYRESKPIVIGNECFIGWNATILHGVTLGDHCIVGVGAVVTKSFPSGSVIGGVPAKLLFTKAEATKHCASNVEN